MQNDFLPKSRREYFKRVPILMRVLEYFAFAILIKIGKTVSSLVLLVFPSAGLGPVREGSQSLPRTVRVFYLSA